MKTGHNENIDYRQRVTSGARPVAAASEPDRRAALHRKELVGVLLLFFFGAPDPLISTTTSSSSSQKKGNAGPYDGEGERLCDFQGRGNETIRKHGKAVCWVLGVCFNRANGVQRFSCLFFWPTEKEKECCCCEEIWYVCVW